MRVLEAGILPDSEIYFYEPSQFAMRVLFGLQHIGIFHCDQRYIVTHPYWESILMIFMDEGRLETEYNGQRFVAEAGDIVLIDCRHQHRYRALSDLRFHYFHFSGHPSAAYCSLIYDMFGGALLKGLCSENMQSIFNQIMMIVRSKISLENEHRISVYIHMILCSIIEDQSKVTHGSAESVDRVIDYMMDNLRENLSIDDIANAVGLNKHYMNRLFVRQTGVTPHKYFNNMRIQEARRLLLTTSMSVENVADACGFQNTSNFIRLFRNHTDMTPSVFRKIPF